MKYSNGILGVVLNVSGFDYSIMDERNKCPVCFEYQLVDPVCLSCGHNICLPCLHLYRSRDSEEAKLCPDSFCSYDRAIPTYLAGKN